jgi:hypothetical protein
LPHPVTLPDELLLKDCETRTGRRRGPGGQHRNVTESAVYLVHLPTGIESQASERREQLQNRRVALKRLRLALAVQHREMPTEGAPPSPLWQSRCPKGRIAINPDHHDFTVLLAEVLDFVVDRRGHLEGAASHFGCSVSQLMKFLGLNHSAWELFNRTRLATGLPELQRR